MPPIDIPISDLKPLLAEVAAGRALSESEAEAAFDIIMSGNATPSQMGAFLMALRVRGESVDEITGAARIMRAKALTIDAPPGTLARSPGLRRYWRRSPSTATAPSRRNRGRPTS